MNKPIKLTQEIKDPNSLLNKFIIYEYKNNSYSLDRSFILYYVYKIYGTKLIVYNIHYDTKRVLQFKFYSFYLKMLNDTIEDSLRKITYISAVYTF